MPIVKEHYLGFVEATFPALLPRYQRAYPGTYAPREYLTKLEARIDRISSRYGFEEAYMGKRYRAGSQPGGRGAAAEPAGQLSLPL
jgi:hypothetical protein